MADNNALVCKHDRLLSWRITLNEVRMLPFRRRGPHIPLKLGHRLAPGASLAPARFFVAALLRMTALRPSGRLPGGGEAREGRRGRRPLRGNGGLRRRGRRPRRQARTKPGRRKTCGEFADWCEFAARFSFALVGSAERAADSRPYFSSYSLVNFSSR